MDSGQVDLFPDNPSVILKKSQQDRIFHRKRRQPVSQLAADPPGAALVMRWGKLIVVEFGSNIVRGRAWKWIGGQESERSWIIVQQLPD